MLVSTRRTPVQGIPNEAQAATASRSNRNSLQSFASRFSAAVASTSPQQTAAVARAAGSSTLERERSNSGTGRKQQLASAGAHRGDDTAGRNLLEIPMDQPPTILTAAGTPLASAAKPNAPT